MKIIAHLEKEISQKNAKIAALEAELLMLRNRLKNKQILRGIMNTANTRHYQMKMAA